MPKRLTLTLVLICLTGLGLGTAIAIGQDDSDSADTLFANLSGSQESPRGDRDGKGAASVVIDGRNVCIAIAVAALGDVQAAHIHRGARGKNGPIVVDPKITPTTGDTAAIGGCATVSSTLARSLKRTPARFYANVHTKEFPNGAIRGQLAQR